jgi:DNA gyrase/topoisomerase IV subunit B
MPIIDVTPEKRLYLSVISEYDMKRSICELIDNAIDLWKKNNRSNLEIRLNLDDVRQAISIEDDAGGVEESELALLLSPGKTTNNISDNVIGYFGVGAKRAVIALAEDVTIKTRFGNGKTCVIHFDDEWISDNPEWKLSYEVAKKNLSSGTTLIELFKLRTPFSKADIESLRKHLSEVYALFILGGVRVILNNIVLTPITFDSDWAYPKLYSPKCFSNHISLAGRDVTVEITSGLINHSGHPDGSYGIFLYCIAD